uniref:TPR_REGION domain-containing protein n=1 Tax=Macrostomum lignano TaxID=282301 RepID=A0A1I8JR48_9PLAT
RIAALNAAPPQAAHNSASSASGAVQAKQHHQHSNKHSTGTSQTMPHRRLIPPLWMNLLSLFQRALARLAQIGAGSGSDSAAPQLKRPCALSRPITASRSSLTVPPAAHLSEAHCARSSPAATVSSVSITAGPRRFDLAPLSRPIRATLAAAFHLAWSAYLSCDLRLAAPHCARCLKLNPDHAAGSGSAACLLLNCMGEPRDLASRLRSAAGPPAEPPSAAFCVAEYLRCATVSFKLPASGSALAKLAAAIQLKTARTNPQSAEAAAAKPSVRNSCQLARRKPPMDCNGGSARATLPLARLTRPLGCRGGLPIDFGDCWTPPAAAACQSCVRRLSGVYFARRYCAGRSGGSSDDDNDNDGDCEADAAASAALAAVQLLSPFRLDELLSRLCPSLPSCTPRRRPPPVFCGLVRTRPRLGILADNPNVSVSGLHCLPAESLCLVALAHLELRLDVAAASRMPPIGWPKFGVSGGTSIACLLLRLASPPARLLLRLAWARLRLSAACRRDWTIRAAFAYLAAAWTRRVLSRPTSPDWQLSTWRLSRRLRRAAKSGREFALASAAARRATRPPWWPLFDGFVRSRALQRCGFNCLKSVLNGQPICEMFVSSLLPRSATSPSAIRHGARLLRLLAATDESPPSSSINRGIRVSQSAGLPGASGARPADLAETLRSAGCRAPISLSGACAIECRSQMRNLDLPAPALCVFELRKLRSQINDKSMDTVHVSAHCVIEAVAEAVEVDSDQLLRSPLNWSSIGSWNWSSKRKHGTGQASKLNWSKQRSWNCQASEAELNTSKLELSTHRLNFNASKAGTVNASEAESELSTHRKLELSTHQTLDPVKCRSQAKLMKLEYARSCGSAGPLLPRAAGSGIIDAADRRLASTGDRTTPDALLSAGQIPDELASLPADLERCLRLGPPLACPTGLRVDANAVTDFLFGGVDTLPEYNRPLTPDERDLALSPDRFDSWAGMALPGASRLQQKLNLQDGSNSSTPVCARFDQALRINPLCPKLLTERGLFAYELHSHASQLGRRGKQLELAAEWRLPMLRLLGSLFYRRPLRQPSGAARCGEECENWLYNYMLGKCCEKSADHPDICLGYYAAAANELRQSGARYPKRISTSYGSTPRWLWKPWRCSTDSWPLSANSCSCFCLGRNLLSVHRLQRPVNLSWIEARLIELSKSAFQRRDRSWRRRRRRRAKDRSVDMPAAAAQRQNQATQPQLLRGASEGCLAEVDSRAEVRQLLNDQLRRVSAVHSLVSGAAGICGESAPRPDELLPGDWLRCVAMASEQLADHASCCETAASLQAACLLARLRLRVGKRREARDPLGPGDPELAGSGWLICPVRDCSSGGVCQTAAPPICSNGVWRLPSDDIDRSGCFAAHMRRAPSSWPSRRPIGTACCRCIPALRSTENRGCLVDDDLRC